MTTPEDKIIEAVARALCRAGGSDPDYDVALRGDPLRAWRLHVLEAKAAIQAYEQAKGEGK